MTRPRPSPSKGMALRRLSVIAAPACSIRMDGRAKPRARAVGGEAQRDGCRMRGGILGIGVAVAPPPIAPAFRARDAWCCPALRVQRECWGWDRLSGGPWVSTPLSVGEEGA